MQVSKEELRRAMREETDEELWSILSVQREDYAPEAMRIAREESRRRGWGEGPVTKPMVSHLVQKQANAKVVHDNGASVGWFSILVILGFLAWGGWEAGRKQLDELGWIRHDHHTPVWIQGDWLIGEYRQCGMPVTSVPLPGSARLICPLGEGTQSSMLPDLTDGELGSYFTFDWQGLAKRFHILRVNYWGRIDRTDRTPYQFYGWRCVRQEESLTCWALD